MDDDKNWIEWGGGERPVAANIPVNVRFRFMNHEGKPCRPAGGYWWHHSQTHEGGDIIAYQVVADRIIHGTANRGERHGMAKLTESNVRKIRTLRDTLRQNELADRFGVSEALISKILHGKIWGWLV